MKRSSTAGTGDGTKKAADIRTVAQKAGVSISTVSRYLNSKVVSPEAEQKIRAAIRELAYTPNRIARSLKLKRTTTLGMVIPDITNTFFPEIVKGVEDAARAAGFHLVLTSSGEDQLSEQDRMNTLETLRCDGVLMILAPEGPTEAERRQRLLDYRLPTVYVDRSPPFVADMVISDNLFSAGEAVRHLRRLGHSNIAMLHTTLEVSSHRDRAEGYRRAMREAGLTPPPGYEVRVPGTMADGFAATLRLLDLNPRPSAIFVTANRLTVGAMAAILDRGLRCPGDISVIGFDDYEWEEAFRPRLTTVAQPSYLMGQRGAELLIARVLGQKTGAPEQVELRSRLVVRESCGIYGGRSNN
jgi:LacI family transcriptional regulator